MIGENVRTFGQVEATPVLRASILQENLKAALKLLKPFVDTRPQLPILANVLIRTQDARLELVVSNLETAYSVQIGAKVESDGALSVHFRTLNDIAILSSPERIDLSVDVSTQTLNMRCGPTVTNLKGIDADEFPMLPNMADAEPLFTICNSGQLDLAKLIKHLAKFAAKEDSRPVLTAILIETTDNLITFTCANGVAFSTAQIGAQYVTPDQSLIVPAKAFCLAFADMLKSDHDIKVYSLGGTVILEQGDRRVYIRTLEGNFPDVQAMIPDHDNHVAIEPGAWLDLFKPKAITTTTVNFARNLITNSDGTSAPFKACFPVFSETLNDGELMVGDKIKRLLLDSLAYHGGRRISKKLKLTKKNGTDYARRGHFDTPVRIAWQSPKTGNVINSPFSIEGDTTDVFMPLSPAKDDAPEDKPEAIGLLEYRWGAYVVNHDENSRHHWNDLCRPNDKPSVIHDGWRLRHMKQSGAIQRLIAHMEADTPDPQAEELPANKSRCTQCRRVGITYNGSHGKWRGQLVCKDCSRENRHQHLTRR